MADLTVSNLNKIVQSGDIEKLFSPSSNDATSEIHTAREMQTQGLSTAEPQSTGKSFGELLRESVDQVNQHQVQADTAIKEMIAGRSKNIHETLLTVERADTSLKLMMQVRNKILDAYREIMRMQV